MPNPTSHRKCTGGIPNHGPVPEPAEHLSAAELRRYVAAVLAEMVRNRDVKWDRQGRPVARVNASDETPEGSSVRLTVDMSAIGMPTDTPLVARSRDGQVVEWSLGETPLARTPRSATPKEAADLLDMDTLLAGFRRWVASEGFL
jgi:hypothetical protein